MKPVSVTSRSSVMSVPSRRTVVSSMRLAGWICTSMTRLRMSAVRTAPPSSKSLVTVTRLARTSQMPPTTNRATKARPRTRLKRSTCHRGPWKRRAGPVRALAARVGPAVFGGGSQGLPAGPRATLPRRPFFLPPPAPGMSRSDEPMLARFVAPTVREPGARSRVVQPTRPRPGRPSCVLSCEPSPPPWPPPSPSWGPGPRPSFACGGLVAPNGPCSSCARPRWRPMSTGWSTT